MRRTAVPLSLLVTLAAACGRAPHSTPQPADGPVVSPPAESPMAPLERRIRERVAREAPGEVAVAVVDLATGLRLGVHDTVVMHAASTMKVPVLLEVFREVERGRLSLDQPIPVTNRFRSIVGDSAYRLSPEDDSELTLYDRVGTTVPLRELLRLMIVRSSNLALNTLVDLVPATQVMRTMEEIGAPDMLVRRGVEDIPAFNRGLNNTTTAGALARVMEVIARCTLTSAASCEAMTGILSAQEFNEMIPAGLPAGTRVAHKTGWITGIQHDAAIIYPPGRPPYVLVVLTRGITDTTAAARVGADVSRLVWEALTSPTFAVAPPPADAAARELLALQARNRVALVSERRFTHRQLWQALAPHLGRGVRREEIGRSGEGRPIYLLTYGHGPTSVLLWSQMHGNEPTATMALADLVRFLDEHPDDARARQWAERLTIHMVPMLNPDGAERFQRYDAYGVDVNRDARRLATPEAQALKRARDRVRPQFGFNLHDQNPRTRVGRSSRLAAIALLAPAADAEGTDPAVAMRARRLAAHVSQGIAPLVGGHVTRYDETFNPRAFGDLMQQWGTSTILIESGGWRHDPEKQYLRRVNFVALVRALDGLASGEYADAPLAAYAGLPPNGPAVTDLVVTGGTVVAPGMPPARLDIAFAYDDPLWRTGARVAEVGDLAEVEARDTLDVSGLYLHPVLTAGDDSSASVDGGHWLRAVTDWVVRRGPEPSSAAVYRITAGVPDTVRDGMR
ncbi:MAG TPA: serine hydrolase [Gemmatimonadaceae bacterium]|nr:serine hydrolase [Gemmatimonadaceae bacterium]